MNENEKQVVMRDEEYTEMCWKCHQCVYYRFERNGYCRYYEQDNVPSDREACSNFN